MPNWEFLRATVMRSPATAISNRGRARAFSGASNDGGSCRGLRPRRTASRRAAVPMPALLGCALPLALLMHREPASPASLRLRRPRRGLLGRPDVGAARAPSSVGAGATRRRAMDSLKAARPRRCVAAGDGVAATPGASSSSTATPASSWSTTPATSSATTRASSSRKSRMASATSCPTTCPTRCRRSRSTRSRPRRPPTSSALRARTRRSSPCRPSR